MLIMSFPSRIWLEIDFQPAQRRIPVGSNERANQSWRDSVDNNNVQINIVVHFWSENGQQQARPGIT